MIPTIRAASSRNFPLITLGNLQLFDPLASVFFPSTPTAGHSIKNNRLSRRPPSCVRETGERTHTPVTLAVCFASRRPAASVPVPNSYAQHAQLLHESSPLSQTDNRTIDRSASVVVFPRDVNSAGTVLWPHRLNKVSSCAIVFFRCLSERWVF